jgi:class 3 adenylate cyclase
MGPGREVKQTAAETVRSARQAVKRRAWREAYDLLALADSSARLTPADLERFAEAAWCIGRIEDCIDAYERAYVQYLDKSQAGAAAFIALWLAGLYRSRRADSVAAGWRNRAERLLTEEPDCRGHGLLAWQQIGPALASGVKGEAMDHANKAYELGRRFRDRDLQALGLLGKAWVLLSDGDVAGGTILLDEAMAAAMGRELSPQVTRSIYCETISACQDMGDYGRASEWTEAWEGQSRREGVAVFSGDCRVHRAQILRLRGDWAAAEKEARRASDEFKTWNIGVRHAGQAVYEIGEIRLLQGNLAAAEDSFQEARQWGYDPQPGWSRLLLAEGKLEAASASMREALGGDSGDMLDRARLLPTQVEIALASGDQVSARLATEELEKIAKTYGTTAFEAGAMCARGELELSNGDSARACQNLRRARQLWEEINNPYEAARARLQLAVAYRAQGDEESAVIELQAAMSAFDRLGAVLDARRAMNLLGIGAAARSQTTEATQTFMFTDIVKSTELIEVIGDDAWADLLRWHDQTLRSLVQSHGGEEIDHAGDGFFLAFDTPISGVTCAIAIQRAFADHRRTHGFAPQIRIGLHTAKARRQGRAYKGREVHIAARIAALANGESILASVATLPAGSGFRESNRQTVTLRGISEPVELARIDWR